jgi:CRP/FNR family transcriptional regulator, cyclic AMP receptor protein
MKLDDLVPLLSKTELFGHLNEDALRSLASKGTRRRHKKGELIFRQGDEGRSVYVLLEGLVKIFLTSERGDEMLLVTLQAPATFGELALVDGLPRSAAVEAIEPVETLSFSVSDLLEFAKVDPSFSTGLLESLASLIRRLTDQASDFVFLDLHGRVAKLLLNFVDTRGERTDEGIVLDLHLTQGDVARMVGGSRQSVNQILGTLSNRGYLALYGRKIVIKRLDLLRRRAGLEPFT